jgi:hypothetical protein
LRSQPINHRLGNEAEAGFGTPESFGIEDRVLTDYQTFRDFHTAIDHHAT